MPGVLLIGALLNEALGDWQALGPSCRCIVCFKITNGLFCHYCYKVIISYFSKITKSETARKCSKEKPESFGDPYCYNYVYWLKKMLMVSQNECSRTTITSAKMKVEMLLISTSHLDGSTLDFLHIFGGCLEQFSQTSMDGCMDLRITSPQVLELFFKDMFRLIQFMHLSEDWKCCRSVQILHQSTSNISII